MVIHVHIHDKQPIRAAGILFIAGDEVLVTKRSEEMNNAFQWDLPGGKMDDIDEGSFRSCAVRECQEEIGLWPDFALHQNKLIPISRTIDDVDYITFACYCDKFEPKLSSEHVKYKWCKLDDLPDKLHWHLKELLEKLAMLGLKQVKEI